MAMLAQLYAKDKCAIVMVAIQRDSSGVRPPAPQGGEHVE
jgi:hypothetical protein